MSRNESPAQIREVVDEGPDRVVRFLRMAILFVVACLVALAGYAVVGGILRPPAPRTQAESVLAIAEAGVRKHPGDGMLWAQLARAQYLTGSKEEAYETIKRSRKSVKDRTVLWVNNQELDMLIRDGKYKKAADLSVKYVKEDGEIRGKEFAENSAKNIKVPLSEQNNENQSSIQLFLLQASAFGSLGEYDKSIEAYDNALLMAPRAADILTLRADVLLKSGDAKKAAKDYEAALKYLPDDTAANAGLKAAKAALSDGSSK